MRGNTPSPFVSLWELDDDDSWTELINVSELLPLGESEYILASTITGSDEVLCFVLDDEDYSSGMKFYLIDPELESYRELNPDTSEYIASNTREALMMSVYALHPVGEDQVLIQNSPSTLLVFDIPSETIKHIPAGEDMMLSYFAGVVEAGNTVYALYEKDSSGMFTEQITKLCTLDIATSTFTDVDNEELTSLLDEYGAKETVRIIQTMRADNSSGERLTMCMRGGIIEYGSNGVRAITDGEGTIMADTSMDVQGHIFVNEDDFILLGNNVTELDSFALYKYEKNAGV